MFRQLNKSKTKLMKNTQEGSRYLGDKVDGEILPHCSLNLALHELDDELRRPLYTDTYEVLSDSFVVAFRRLIAKLGVGCHQGCTGKGECTNAGLVLDSNWNLKI